MKTIVKKAILTGLLIFFIHYELKSQLQADYWIYSSSSYVKFNTATNPTRHSYPCSDCTIGEEFGAATYSDENGNLLFYSNGVRVFDKTFRGFPSTDLLQGGTGLLGPLYASTYTSQGTLAIPYPGTTSKYILFHINSRFSNGFNSPLNYSVIDMSLRNGLGEIDPAQRNIPLLGGVEVSFKLTAVQHCNKQDIWVVGHLSNSNQYFSLLVTSAGVQPTPVYFTGSFISNSNIPNITNENDIGCIKISATGTRLAAAYRGLDYTEILDFNTSTGAGSNVKRIKTIPQPADTTNTHGATYLGPFGVDFSPSANKLYISATYFLRNTRNNGLGAFVYQYDATLPTESLIQNTQYEVCKLDTNAAAGAIQIANNGKMYVNISSDLFSIQYPEVAGSGCTFSGSGLNMFLEGGANPNLPGYIQSYFQYPVITTGNCQSQTVSFAVQDTASLISNIAWDFGDPQSGINNSSTVFNPTHLFSSEGIYTVKAILYNSSGCIADTIKKIVNAGKFSISIGNDTNLCRGDSLQLSINSPGLSLLWSDSSSGSSFWVKESGVYWVSAALGGCLSQDTIVIANAELPQFSLGTDTSVCSNSSISLRPSIVYPFSNYQWSTSASTESISISNSGEYWLEIEDINGCIYRDTLNVISKVLENFTIGNDTAICEGDSIALTAAANNATAYLWSTGATLAQIKTGNEGIYWCDVTTDGCIYRDSLQLIINSFPVVNLGKDTTLCEGINLRVDASNSNATYLWQDNTTNSFYTITREGSYSVIVTNNGCSTKDTINVSYQLKPYFSLGNDRLICSGQPILLQPQINALWQLAWQDGSTNNPYTVTHPGNYFLVASNICGSFRDDITITEGGCNMYIPSAFTPNGDVWNNEFKVSGTSLITQFDLKIYNRYGQLVFETKDKNEGWNGLYKGQSAEPGAYVYLLQYKSNSASQLRIRKGTLLLIR